MNELTKMFLVLTAICLVSALGLTALNEGLAEQIFLQEEVNLRGPAVHDIFADAANDPVADAFTQEIDGQAWRLYPLVEDGVVKAVALETAGAGGYGGNVSVITGVDLASASIVGVRVTKHSETPGIGTRVADPGYLRTYAGRPVDGTTFALSPAGGDIEAVSGATRTSTAVVAGVRGAAEFVKQHKDELSEWAAAARSGSQ